VPDLYACVEAFEVDLGCGHALLSDSETLAEAVDLCVQEVSLLIATELNGSGMRAYVG
jgi:hypothetical protein